MDVQFVCSLVTHCDLHYCHCLSLILCLVCISLRLEFTLILIPTFTHAQCSPSIWQAKLPSDTDLYHGVIMAQCHPIPSLISLILLTNPQLTLTHPHHHSLPWIMTDECCACRFTAHESTPQNPLTDPSSPPHPKLFTHIPHCHPYPVLG